MEKRRLDYIDRMKGIAILLVIVGHIIQFNNINGGSSNKLFGIIYSFHMPLFFILSGYIASYGRDRIINGATLATNLFKKTYTLLLPLLTWSLLVPNYFFVQSFQPIGLNDIVNVLIHPGLWFLQVLFEIQVLFSIFCLLGNSFNKKSNIIIDIVLVSFIFLLPLLGYLWIDKSHFSTLILFSFFFFFGSFVSRYLYLENLLMNKFVYALAVLTISSLTAYWNINGNTLDDLLKVIVSISAFIALLHITRKLKLPQMIDSQIQLFGKESLAIYVMQFYLTSQISLFSEITGSNLFIQFLFIAMIAIPIAYICVFVHKIFEKSDILNLLFYGKQQ